MQLLAEPGCSAEHSAAAGGARAASRALPAVGVGSFAPAATTGGTLSNALLTHTAGQLTAAPTAGAPASTSNEGSTASAAPLPPAGTTGQPGSEAVTGSMTQRQKAIVAGEHAGLQLQILHNHVRRPERHVGADVPHDTRKQVLQLPVPRHRLLPILAVTYQPHKFNLYAGLIRQTAGEFMSYVARVYHHA